MTHAFRAVLLGAVTLTAACGGGGDSTPVAGTEPLPDPVPAPEPDALPAYPVVFAPNFAPSGPEPLDASFNLRVAGRTAGGADESAGVLVYGLSFSDFTLGPPNRATLVLPDGRTVALTLNGAMNAYEGTLAGTDYSVSQDFGGIDFAGVRVSSDAPGVQSLGYGIIGWETPVAGLPASGTATFDGLSVLLVNEDGAASPLTEVGGTFRLNVDFATSAVTGEVFALDPLRIGIADGRVVGNGFQGRLVETGTAFDTLDGRTDGTFYGDTAGAAAGTFEGTFAASTGTGSIAGAFGGPRLP